MNVSTAQVDDEVIEPLLPAMRDIGQHAPAMRDGNARLLRVGNHASGPVVATARPHTAVDFDCQLDLGVREVEAEFADGMEPEFPAPVVGAVRGQQQSSDARLVVRRTCECELQ